MKKISNVFILIISIISIFLCTYVYQMETSKDYDLSNAYAFNRTMRIPEGIKADKALLERLTEIADECGIVLEKDISTVEETTITTHYTNMKIQDLENIFGNIKWNHSVSDTYLVSTLKKDKSDGYIADFLENDYHRYMSLNTLNDSSYLGGSYIVFADNEFSIQSFFKEVSALIGVDVNTLYGGFQENIFPYTFVFAVYFVIIIILFFMAALFITFDTYNKSKQLGIYKLCGYSPIDIIKMQAKKTTAFYAMLLGITSIVLLLTVSNITVSFMLLVYGLMILIALVNMILYALIIKLMLKKVSYNDLLKNKSLTNTMTHIAVIFKAVSVGILSLGFVFASMFFFLTKAQVDKLEQFSDYSSYGFFESFEVGEDQSSLTAGSDNELSKAGIKLYKRMYNNGILYADFGDFKEGVMKQNNLFIANVDTNYIHEFQLTTPNGKAIEIDANSADHYYLIPSSKMKQINEIKVYGENKYEGMHIEFIEYADKKLPTLNPNVAADTDFMVDSPIINVITLGNASADDVLAFGGYYDTPLKFKVIDSKEKMYNSLLPILNEYGLSDNLKSNSLVTYNDLFGQEINSKKEQLSILVGVLVILLFVICCISFQSILLYLKGNSKEIAVKRFIGIPPQTVFSKITIENIVAMMLCFFIVGIIFRKQINIYAFSIFAISMVVLDIAIIYITVKIKLKSFIIKTLKGDQL